MFALFISRKYYVKHSTFKERKTNLIYIYSSVIELKRLKQPMSISHIETLLITQVNEKYMYKLRFIVN